MYFDSFSDFLAMGGYAAYVWSAFGLTYLSMAMLWIVSVRRKTKLLNQVRDKLARQARIDAAKHMENTL
ncbi:heme exporter protein CcmD [Vibrio cholerae]|uniref:heme exporter protein CcmD n=1 Tax=Vibrio cholerae TaxID=666 RepID=UPI000172CE03|nr:heme exporter protein CcmD [Vibrio cholerae]EGR2120636.1 heme exporter protein CcmD [Vibrio cholerae]EGR4360108.1 heme exporter protein CcmD [Vibrio cholerae]EHB5526284.1 heme exporter protein CcmD [Vibrio cholerae]EHS4947047.1 heme exporter protein CcmD [Vibrio cholerae]EIA3111351.1 heme exporter protein CcmD [Vibrio cholerae]